MLKRLLFAVLMLCAFAAQAVVYSSPWGPKPQFIGSDGAPMSSGTLSTFLATTTTPQVTYTDSTGGSSNPTTITLNVRGETPNELWLASGVSYKFVLKDSAGSTIWTVDNISGINDVTAQQGSEWISSGFTPTFVSATSFTVTGDQTQTLQVGRRLKTTNTAGTVYSTITASTFAAVTTVTVANDSGSLDSGLSAVSYSLLSAINPAVSADMVARKGTAVASSGTTNIWGIVGDYVHVTGTTTITSLGTAPYAGALRTIVFDGALLLTHNATSLVLPGNANINTAANDRAIVRADTTANMVVVSYVRANGQPVIGTSIPRRYISGFQMSAAGGSANISIGAGQTTNGGSTVWMNLSSATTKTTSAWAVGTGNGCLDTGAIANNTWYHFYAIYRSDTGVTDVLCSTSASAPTLPTSYVQSRRIGSSKTDGSAQWIGFTQNGDTFLWLASVLDVNANNPGAAAVSRALTVPTGVKVQAIVNWAIVNAGAGVAPFVYVSSLDQNDEAPSGTVAPLANAGTQVTTGAGNAATQGYQLTTITDTSAQVRTRLSASDANVTIRGATLGWIDFRLKD